MKAPLNDEQLRMLLGKVKEGREKDPLRLFEPFGQQRAFIHSVLYGRYMDSYYFGGNRSGKTAVGAYIGSYLARFGYPEDSPLAPKWTHGKMMDVKDRATAGWVSGLDYPMIRDTVQPKYVDNGYGTPGGMKPFIPKEEIEHFDRAANIVKLKNGSLIGFKSAESGAAKYQGADKHWIHFDEEHPQRVVDEASIRVGAQRLNMFTTATILPPEGALGGVSWLYGEVILPWKQGKLPHVGIFRASIYDNPHIPRGEIDRLELRYPPGSIQNRIRLGGELLPGMSGARVYAAFDQGLNTADRLREEVDPRVPLAWCWDFNVEPGITLLGQMRGGVFFVVREFVLEQSSIKEMCRVVREDELMKGHRGEVIVYGDATGNARSAQSGMSSYTMMLNEMLRSSVRLRVEVGAQNPSVVDRVNAMNEAMSGWDEKRGLVVDRECVEFLRDMDQVVGDGRGGIKKVGKRGDPYARRTHASDAVGYWVSRVRPVRREVWGEGEVDVLRMRKPRYR